VITHASTLALFDVLAADAANPNQLPLPCSPVANASLSILATVVIRLKRNSSSNNARSQFLPDPTALTSPLTFPPVMWFIRAHGRVLHLSMACLYSCVYVFAAGVFHCRQSARAARSPNPNNPNNPNNALGLRGNGWRAICIMHSFMRSTCQLPSHCVDIAAAFGVQLPCVCVVRQKDQTAAPTKRAQQVHAI
jgi:hypothetical protein